LLVAGGLLVCHLRLEIIVITLLLHGRLLFLLLLLLFSANIVTEPERYCGQRIPP
jgi:hypothetical protein